MLEELITIDEVSEFRTVLAKVGFIYPSIISIVSINNSQLLSKKIESKMKE